VDLLFYLRLTFLVGLVAFVLSVLGINTRLYASFMATTVGGTLLVLYLYFPRFVADLPMLTTGFVMYGFMLLVRSRGEHKRTKQWIRARLNQRLLMERLTRLRRKESEANDALRAQSAELEDKNRQLNQLAIHDGLTGAYRRGHIEAELQRLVRSVQRKPSEFSVMLMDIDWFKKVNDVHGHTVGDEVLRTISALVQKTLRGSDLFGRWGGEEFIALMPETSIGEAVEAAERVREAVRLLEFTGEENRFHVSISIGVAKLDPGETADMLVHRADKALYAAKHAGRDRVLAYEMGQSLFTPLRS
jgi:diguanylate cyclase (GGDEF)-like protein